MGRCGNDQSSANDSIRNGVHADDGRLRHCPACRLESRDGLICLSDDCDFVLFIELGDRIHPAFFEFAAEKTEEFKKLNNS